MNRNLPAALRKGLYRVQYTLSGVMMCIGVGYGSSQHALPHWYAPTAAVLSAAWTYLGMTAARNTPSDDVGRARRGQAGQADVGLILLVLTFVGVVLLLFRVHLGG